MAADSTLEVDVTTWLHGRFRDELRAADGTVRATDWQNNLVTYRALDLLARLLANQPELDGGLYCAVGAGDAAWDADLPTPDARVTHLVREIFRKPLDLANAASYDATTHTLTLSITFGAGEAVGTLREFGIFGGDVTAAPDSGYLVNYKIHAPIDKKESDTLQRTVEFKLGATV
ncbi:MAG: hypothetical protein HY741_15015 [Chloroflexi bacterium]|nr:hypothetical protein [Chloroflexota bacterium]